MRRERIECEGPLLPAQRLAQPALFQIGDADVHDRQQIAGPELHRLELGLERGLGLAEGAERGAACGQGLGELRIELDGALGLAQARF